MSRPLTATFSAALAAALSLAAFAPLSAAQTVAGPYFSVELAQPTGEAQAIAGGVLFTCEGTACTGPRSGDRPLRVCSELRREVGQIASFAVRGEAVSADLLARCNG
jgi:hypothetical protein